MRDRTESPATYAWIVYVCGTISVGGLGGYVLSLSGTGSTPGAATVSQSTAAPAAGTVPLVDEAQLRAYRDILARDPKNVDAAVQAGNALYDARRYPEAVEFYERAIALDPRNIHVSTDLGTALWYSGNPDAAIRRYNGSLGIDPAHAQTLFNLGIVRADGKQDYAGAIAAWELLLEKNPAYPESARVRSLIGDARRKLPAAH